MGYKYTQTLLKKGYKYSHKKKQSTRWNDLSSSSTYKYLKKLIKQLRQKHTSLKQKLFINSLVTGHRDNTLRLLALQNRDLLLLYVDKLISDNVGLADDTRLRQRSLQLIGQQHMGSRYSNRSPGMTIREYRQLYMNNRQRGRDVIDLFGPLGRNNQGQDNIFIGRNREPIDQQRGNRQQRWWMNPFQRGTTVRRQGAIDRLIRDDWEQDNVDDDDVDEIIPRNPLLTFAQQQQVTRNEQRQQQRQQQPTENILLQHQQQQLTRNIFLDVQLQLQNEIRQHQQNIVEQIIDQSDDSQQQNADHILEAQQLFDYSSNYQQRNPFLGQQE